MGDLLRWADDMTVSAAAPFLSARTVPFECRGRSSMAMFRVGEYVRRARPAYIAVHEAGYPDSAIMEILGWSSMAMLWRYLGKIAVAQLKRYPRTRNAFSVVRGEHSATIGPATDKFEVCREDWSAGVPAMDRVNLGQFALLASAVLCFAAALGYGIKGDWHRAAYAFFLGCLEASVTL